MDQAENKYFFAYGSNMDSIQLRNRIGRSIPAIPVYVDNYRFCYNKLGNDGSGKANIIPEEGSKVLGVIYEFKPEAFNKMDQ